MLPPTREFKVSQAGKEGAALPPVLSEESLNALAGQIKNGITCLKLAMLLNIPNTTVVQFVLNMTGDAGFRESTKEEITKLMGRLLNYWGHLRANAKPKDRVQDMGRALRECGLDPLADILNAAFGNGARFDSSVVK